MSKSVSQLNKFKRAAKEAECDTDEATFDGALKKIAPKAEKKPDEPAPKSKD